MISKSKSAITKTSALIIIAVLILAAVGGIGAFYSIYRPIAQARNIVFQLDWIASGYHTDLFVAKEKFWPELGLDVTIVRGAGDTTRKVAMGVAEFGFEPFDVGTRLRAEESLLLRTIFSAGTKNVNGLFYIKGRDAGRGPIDLKADIKSLEGKLFGTPDWSASFVQLPAFCGLAGVNSSKVTHINMDAGAMMPALISGTVDVIDCGSGNALRYVNIVAESGLTGDFVLYADYGLDMIADSIWTSDRLISKDPVLVAKFVEGIQKGFKYTCENIDEAVKIFIKYNPAFAGSEEDVKLEWIGDYAYITDKALSESHGLGYLPDDTVRKAVENVYLMHDIPEERHLPNYADMYTNDYIQKIYPASWPW